MRTIALLGATGGTGRAAGQALVAAGFRVIALARNPAALAPYPGLKVAEADATNGAEVARALRGAEGVVVSLGNSQNPFALIFGAKRHTSRDVCEVGTRHVIAAMRAGDMSRLVVVTAYGVGDTKALPSLMTRLFFRLLLKEHMADKEKQEALVKSSGLEWTLVQPVALTDRPATGEWFASVTGQVRKPGISRLDVASFIAGEILHQRYIRQTVTLSG